MVALEAAGHDTIGLRFNEGWRRESRAGIERFLFGVSHILAIASPEATERAWFAYLVGLARGSAMPVTLFLPDGGAPAGHWLDDLNAFRSIAEVLEHYTHEAVDWNERERRRMAKASLLELGISWHAESLAQCVKEGDTKAVELFLDSGFPADIRDKTGVPLLCLATRARHLSVADLLLDRGADIDAQSDDRGYSALMDAAQQGEGGILDRLLERGASPDLRSKDGQTALVLAVGRNDAPMVSRLLESGADPDLADKLGLSARKYAKLFHDSAVDAAFAAYDAGRA